MVITIESSKSNIATSESFFLLKTNILDEM